MVSSSKKAKWVVLGCMIVTLPRRKPHDFRSIELVTDPDIESPGHHRDMLNRWMPVSRDLGPPPGT